MPSEDTKILEFNQYQKSDKTLFFIYADLACLIEEIDGCTNNPENTSTTNVSEHTTSGLSMSKMSSFKNIKISCMMHMDIKIVGKSFVNLLESTQQR